METQLPKITVEKLQIKDLEWFVEVAATRMLLEELKRPELLNEDHIYRVSHYGMTSGTCLVAKIDNTPIGAIGAILAPNMFNPDIKTLVEIFWYVLPEYRKGRAGAMLLMAFEDLGGEVADESTLSLLGTSEIASSSLERRGWYAGEVAFRKQYKE